MATEIERKFLVRDQRWKIGASGKAFRQGYLATEHAGTVRVRLVGEQAWLTIKGRTEGYSRLEFEYEIPLADGREILDRLCPGPTIDKTRYRIEHAGHVWEVDAFHGANEGLVVAEIELTSEDESFARPEWLGEEVSGDPRYFNSNLVRAPFLTWK